MKVKPLMKINFNYYQKNNWQALKLEAINLIDKSIEYCEKKNQSFYIKIKQDRTSKQLKGFHRLLNQIADFLKKETGEYWDTEKAKQLIKKQYGYVSRYRGVEICKSCKKASKEDMIGLIKTAEVFGAELGIEDCYLKSQEQIEFEKYYNLK